MKISNLLLLVALFFTYTTLQAKPVPERTAKQLALNFLNHNLAARNQRISLEDLKLSQTEKSSDDSNLYYTFIPKDGVGFIIIAADDASRPVLGYSLTSTYRTNEANSAFLSWMTQYADEIEYIQKNDLPAVPATKTMWQNYLTGNFEAQRSVSAVEPLCTAMFDQSPFVNDMTPFDKEANKNCVTGCPATAMSIIMKKWQHPYQGTGFHSYTHPKFGTVSANFGNTIYDWSQIPDTISEPNDEIAKVMFHSGVAVEMQYTAEESGAYILIDSPTPMANCEYAYKTYFGYARSVKGLYREDFSDEVWIEKMLTELDQSRPMQYAGFGGGGHTFVCDGYDDAFLFHMNWGWGGLENGYFELNSLNPGAGGIGSGEGTYNKFQQAIMGIEPGPGSTSSAPKFGLGLGSAISIDQSPLYVDSAFNVTVNLKYGGSSDYTTSVAALIFNGEGIFVDYVGIEDDVTFQDGKNYDFVFASEGFSTIPGNHTIGIYASQSTDTIWHLIKQSTFKNPIDINVSGGLNDLILSGALLLPETTVTENTSFEVNTTITNKGTTTFNGGLVFDVFDYEAKYITTVYEDDSVTVNPNESLPVSFVVENEGIEPGSYYLAGFSSSDKENFVLFSNDSFRNPVIFDIIESPIVEDAYEFNNNTASAFPLSITFADDKASLATTGSNFHIALDIDHYVLNFEPGYNYTVKAKLIDEHSLSNMGEYDVDAYFTYDAGQGVSPHINSDLEKEFTINGAGSAKIKVSPFFVGFTGSYQMEFEIERTIIVGVEENDLISFNLFPNPSNGQMTIQGDFSNIDLKNISITSILGATVDYKSLQLNHANEISIDATNLPTGVYFINLRSEKSNTYKSFKLVK